VSNGIVHKVVLIAIGCMSVYVVERLLFVRVRVLFGVRFDLVNISFDD